MLVKRVVFFLRRLRAGPQPDRLAGVEHLLAWLLPFVLLTLRVRILRPVDNNGVLDEIGILLDELPNAPGLQELLIFLAEVEDHIGAAPGLDDLLDGELSLAIRFPFDAVFGL